MNAAETIQAAIEKLEDQRSTATAGPWTRYEDHGLIGLMGDEGSIAIDYFTPDADLIVTLHRTIDAQLAILRHALARAKSKVATGGNERSVWSHERDAYGLAALILNDAAAMHDAILGEVSDAS